MTGHLTPEHLAAYRARSLAPGDLIAADFHLAACDLCRSLLAAPEPNPALLHGIAAAKQAHLSYEQMEAYADGALDPTAKDLVLAHVSVCARCATELREFASFIPVMDAPIDKASKIDKSSKSDARKAASEPSFWRRITSGITGAHWAMAAGAAAAVVIVAIVIPTNTPTNAPRDTAQRDPAQPRQQPAQQFSPTGVDALAASQLSALSPDVRTDISRIVDSPEPIRPESLAHLAPQTPSALRTPVSVVVPDQRPTLRWSPVPGPASVTVYAGVTRVASSGELTANEWQIPLSLERGRAYRWTLTANGVTVGEAAFEILPEADFAEWTAEQLRFAGSHILLGALAQHLGMLDEAQREFVALQLEKPQSETAARLLKNLEAIRGPQ